MSLSTDLPRLRFSREELLASHSYARANGDSGRIFHGGFTAEGAYVSPRTLYRRPAADAWSKALLARGWPLVDPCLKLGDDLGYPNAAQHEILLGAGLGKALWDQLTRIGILEQRGGRLLHFESPDMQTVIVEDIAETALGHINGGLLPAHGMDEAGDPATPTIGAHDVIWFAIRDLIFGEDAYPVLDPPESLTRPADAGELAALPAFHGRTLDFLMNVLMVEARAESLFGICLRLFRDPTLFRNRRDQAERAALLVERISADETLHLLYLSTVISEFRSFTILTLDGARVSGAEIVDPVWAPIRDWHSIDERRATRDAVRARLEIDVMAAKGESGRELLAAIDALEAEPG